jgi:anti-anti-sigma regulatory factor
MISNTGQAYLQSQRLFLRTTSRTVVILAGIFTLFCLAALLAAPNVAMSVFLGVVVLAGLGSWLTLSWLSRRSIEQAVLPIALSIFAAALLCWLFLPGYVTLAVGILMIVVVLISAASNRRITMVSAIICTLVVIGMIGGPASPWVLADTSVSLSAIHALACGMVVVVIWQIADQYTAAQGRALGEAHQRAAEAEAAQAEAEAARAEAEAHSANQRRLLDLVESLEVPIIPIGRNVLVAPLVGSFDARRIETTQRLLLDMVARQRAHSVILDVTGISAIDTDVARALITTAQSVRLLGAQTLISGISASVAQTLVGLGLALDALQIAGDMGQAIDMARDAGQLDR